MTDSTPLFFLHVPKAGGTSFRLAAEIFFGENNLIYDYGKDSGITSEVIQNYCYRNNDLYGLSEALSGSGARIIVGHMPAAKFSPIVGIGNTICFVRDPAEQLISHYRHHKRDNGYADTFVKFASSPAFNSVQSRMLNGMPLEAFGFLGLTEHFHSSVELINEQYGLNLTMQNENVTASNVNEKTVVTDQMRDIAIENTQDEKVLYDKVLSLFSKRKIAQEQGQAFVHGTVTGQSSRAISGFAFVHGSDSAVQVHLDINGKTTSGPIFAQLHRPLLAAYKVVRNGFVGFDFRIAKLVKGDIVSCIATETGQVLWNTICKDG